MFIKVLYKSTNYCADKWKRSPPQLVYSSDKVLVALTSATETLAKCAESFWRSEAVAFASGFQTLGGFI